MVAQGMIVGRISEQGSDEIGRWNWMKMKSKMMNDVYIINAYKSVGNIKGDTTISSQEYRAYLREGRREPERVRKHFNRDIKEFIKKIHDEGNLALVLMDANTDINHKSIQQICSSLGMMIIKPKDREGNDINLYTREIMHRLCYWKM